MKVLLLTLALGLSLQAQAQTAKTQEAAAAPPAAEAAGPGDFLRCERMRNVKLAEFKSKLVENCNLNKQFSFSTTDIGVDSSFTYCCHKK